MKVLGTAHFGTIGIPFPEDDGADDTQLLSMNVDKGWNCRLDENHQ
jgi:hypothetical protein